MQGGGESAKATDAAVKAFVMADDDVRKIRGQITDVNSRIRIAKLDLKHHVRKTEADSEPEAAIKELEKVFKESMVQVDEPDDLRTQYGELMVQLIKISEDIKVAKMHQENLRALVRSV